MLKQNGLFGTESIEVDKNTPPWGLEGVYEPLLQKASPELQLPWPKSRIAMVIPTIIRLVCFASWKSR